MDFLQTFLQHVTPKPQSKPKVQQFVRREDLNKKKTCSASPKVKKKVRFESKPSIQNEESKKHTEAENAKEGEVSREKSAVQVKILMRKEEANLLLSKFKDGGALQLEDVAMHISRDRSNKKDY